MSAGSTGTAWASSPAGFYPPEHESGRWRALSRDALPLFRRDVGGDGGLYAAFYAPGCLCVVPPAEAEAFAATAVAGSAAVGWAARLHTAATRASARARRLGEVPFRPECLTLYLNQACNLRCIYCYADPTAPDPTAPDPTAPDAVRSEPAPAWLDLASIESAAHMVAANCRERDLPFYAGLHGGGEPLLDPGRAETVLRLLDTVAQEHGVQPFYYVATNGVMPEAVAHWLAGRAHLVGLSCDGPPAIHDRQRPTRAGQPSLEVVERTARVLRAAGTPFRVRATVTHHSAGCLPEVVDDICRRLAPREVHVEPVYSGGRSGEAQALAPVEVSLFVAGYLAARDVAEGYGVELTTSGSRLESIHGPYCHLFRQVLNLVPGGLATVCFKTATAAAARHRGGIIGAHNPASGRFELDGQQVVALRARLAARPARCRTCLNGYHCAGDCPDTCRLDVADGDTSEPGFRCVMLHTLTSVLLDRRATELWAQVTAGKVDVPHGTDFS